MAKITMEVDTRDKDSIYHVFSTTREMFTVAFPQLYVSIVDKKDVLKPKRRNTKTSRRTELLILAILVLAYAGIAMLDWSKSDLIRKQHDQQQQQIIKTLSTLKCQKSTR